MFLAEQGEGLIQEPADGAASLPGGEGAEPGDVIIGLGAPAEDGAGCHG